MTWTIPNILTVARLLAAPALALAYAGFDRPAADWIAFWLFVLAALTDFADGRLARAWGLESNFGRMLDPIADKAMVVIALSMLVGLSQINPLILVPAAFILLREVFVSGLREFLGADAGRLKVTYLAKWKTTVQMVAIPVLLLAGLARHEGFEGSAIGFVEILGLVLIWLAAALTLLTGFDYLRKALPYLREPQS
jgi:CDP-diacylglycerol--glycerol-3-phosphate 3-phosphatidyltransferase